MIPATSRKTSLPIKLLLLLGLFFFFHASYSIYETYHLFGKDPSSSGDIIIALDIKLELFVGYALTLISLLIIYTNLIPINYTEKYKNLTIDNTENLGFDFTSFVGRRTEVKI